MKTILVPTDFSAVSKNALEYAVEIAKLTNAKLTLLHVFHVPVTPSEVPVVIPTMDELEKECLHQLNKIKHNMLLKHGKKMQVECVCKCGFPISEINFFAESNKVDLIVMGMEGTGYLSEKLIGSTTTSLIKKAKCPVLAIHKHVKFKSMKKILLACDYETIPDEAILGSLKEFASLFKSHIYVLNVVPEFELVPVVAEGAVGTRLEHTFKNVEHSFHFAKNEDVVDGINEFVDNNKMDMVVMIPRMHAAFRSLFHSSVTKRMTFHSKVPVLALHE